MDKEREGKPWLFFLKCLLAAYILTGALLILLSLLVYKLRLSEQIVSAAVIGIYIAVNLAAGWLTGKKMQSRKFLWGLLMGSAYFLILTVVSLAVDHDLGKLPGEFLTVLVLCGGSGTLGGMLG